MGGNGSGRRTMRNEEKRAKVIDASWDRLSEIVNDKTHPLRDKTAIDVALRDITQHIKGEGLIESSKIFIIREAINKAMPNVIKGADGLPVLSNSKTDSRI